MTAKSYRIGCVAGEPNMDSLPVAKIIDYPLEKRDYKPYAQAVLGIGGAERSLFLRMWAFEVSPPEGSTLSCVLYPYVQSPDRALSVRIRHEGDRAQYEVGLLEAGAMAPGRLAAHRIKCHPHNGEDLQGVYWGMLLELPVQAIEELGGAAELEPGTILPGNFYKTCEGRSAHYGSLFRANWERPYARVSMGELRIVSY